MQLIIVILVAFGLGYWLAQRNALEQVTNSAKKFGDRLRRKSQLDKSENSEGQVISISETETT